NMHAAPDAVEREFLMQVGRGCDGDRIDPCRKQPLHFGKGGAAERTSDQIARLGIGVGNAYEAHACKISKDAGMIAAHYARAPPPRHGAGRTAFGRLPAERQRPPCRSRWLLLCLARLRPTGDARAQPPMNTF